VKHQKDLNKAVGYASVKAAKSDSKSGYSLFPKQQAVNKYGAQDSSEELKIELQVETGSCCEANESVSDTNDSVSIGSDMIDSINGRNKNLRAT
jgi:hypothetical protein